MKSVFLSASTFVLAILLCVLISAQSLAQTPTDVWSQNVPPDIYETHDILSYDSFDAKWRSDTGAHAGDSCTELTLEYATNGDATSGCWYVSALGLHSNYGNYFKPHDDTYARLMGEDVQLRFIPTPDASIFMELRRTLDGEQLALRRFDNTQLKTVATYDHGITMLDFVDEPTFILKRSSGSNWNIDGDMPYVGMWYSPNGKFLLIANHEEGTVVRINLETFAVAHINYLHYGDTDKYALLAVSDSGVIAANVFGHSPYIIRTESCDIPEYGYVAEEATVCDVTDLGVPLKSLAPETNGYAYFLQFNSNSALDIYSNTSGNYEKFRAFAPGTFTPGTNYLALGDSYASGEGAGRYYAGTDINDNRCHLSKRSYPFLLGTQLNLSSARSVACSGAKIQNIIGPERLSNDKEDKKRTNQATLEQKDQELGRMLPGLHLQKKFSTDLRPDIITVSISGNDAMFADFLTECTVGGTCHQTDAERAPFVHAIHQFYDRLVDTYSQLRSAQPIGGRVYALGYPQLMSDHTTCGENAFMNHQERTLSIQFGKYLNYVIEKAATKAGVVYVDISQALRSYRLCDNMPTAMHGANFGFSDAHNWHVISKESFHPTSFGHMLLTEEIRRITNGFTVQNPRPSRNTQPPRTIDAVNFDILTTELILDDYAEALRYARITDGEVVVRGRDIIGTIIGRFYDFRPNSPYIIKLFSDPIELGTFMSDDQGNVAYSFKIPENVQPGVHRLRIFGTNTAGNQIELRQLTYVAVTEEDWDGDGRPNESQPCGVSLRLNGMDTPSDNWCGNPTQLNDTLIPGHKNQRHILPRSISAQRQIQLADTRVTPVATPQSITTTYSNPESPNRSISSWFIYFVPLLPFLVACYWYIRKRFTK